MGTRFFCRICRNAEVAASCMSVWAKWRTSWKAQIQWEICLQGGRRRGGGSWEWDLSYNHTKIFSTIKSFTKFDIKYPQCGMWNKKVKIHKIRKLKMQMKDPQWSYGSSNLMYQWGSSCRMDSSSITYNIQTGVLPITSKHRDMIATEICLLQTFYSHKINFKTCVCLLTDFFFLLFWGSRL